MVAPRADISMHHIPVKGGIGTLLFIVLIVVVLLVDLPQLRWPTAAGIGLGLALGVFWIFSRRRAGLPSHPHSTTGITSPRQPRTARTPHP